MSRSLALIAFGAFAASLIVLVAMTRRERPEAYENGWRDYEAVEAV